VRVTWWGHSTATLDEDGVRLLTDPLLRNRLGPLRRRAGIAPSPDLLAPHAVLVSHLHADHLDIASLRRLDADIPLLVPRGTANFLRRQHRDLADRCVELAVGDELPVRHLRIRAVPAAHDWARLKWSKHRAPAIGFTVHGRHNAWFGGDTGLFEEMSALGPLDLALVPVGGWGPTLGEGHLDPTDAVEALRRSAPALAVPVHFGTFWPIGLDRVRPDRFHGPGREFAALAGAGAPEVRVTVLAHGESLDLDPPAQPDRQGAPLPAGEQTE
jgi:L-ascorbate metabolism protein UlaG (beta-lactamase superfamily)